jgi:hypothetical protein
MRNDAREKGEGRKEPECSTELNYRRDLSDAG